MFIEIRSCFALRSKEDWSCSLCIGEHWEIMNNEMQQLIKQGVQELKAFAFSVVTVKRWYTFDIHFEGAGGRACGDVQYYFFLLKKIGNWIYAMTIHRAESNINIWLTKNLFLTLVSDNEAINCGLIWIIERVVNLNVTWLELFLFWFRSFSCTVRLLFHSLLERVEDCLKLDVPGQGGEKNVWT